MSQPHQGGEVHRADPAYKRQMAGWVALTVVAGTLALFALNRWLAALRAAGDPIHAQTWLQRILAALCVMLAVAAVIYGLRLRAVARATRKERRWPPSTMRTTQDVRVRYLTSADALVHQMQLGATVLWVLATALVGWAGWLFWLAR
jgi:hypothetical protein